MNSNQSIINLRVAFLAVVMVTWGVVEFALHTLRPNTIQREDKIVEVFKRASDTIWESHKKLQLDASNLSNTLQKTEVSHYPDFISGSIDKNLHFFSDWLLVRDEKAQWWSENLTLGVVAAMLDATSVLHSNQDGVYVIASSKWTSNGSDWQLLGSTKIFNISVKDSKFGDVYEASIPTLSSMDPTPFYLEGSPDLLPFDHRFSIVRINDDFTTGHLALSTLDPDVRNFVNPLWMYGLRTLFFLIVALCAWRILILLVYEKNETIKLTSKISFILFFGWFTVLLDIVQFWSGLSTADKLFQKSILNNELVHFAWISVIYLIAGKSLISHFNRERFFDHGTRFNKTSLTLFSVGSLIGIIIWFILLYYNELSALNWSRNIDYSSTNFNVIVVGFLWFVLVATTFKLIGGLLKYIQKSVKYQVSWVLQILITGHIYMFTILFILNYTSGNIDLIKTCWMFLALPIGIWMLYKLLNSENSTDSIFRQSLDLSWFPVLIAYPLFLYESFDTVKFVQVIPSFIGIWIRSFICSFVVVSITSSDTSRELGLINLNFKGLATGHSESRLALTSILVIVVFFISPPIAQYLAKSELEQNYTRFPINQSNQHPVMGSYKPGILGLPVFESWVISLKPDFSELLEYDVFKVALTNTTLNTLNWSANEDVTAKTLQVYKSTGSDIPSENFQILATTVDSYPRIFGRISSVISSLSILAVLSIHFFVGIVRKYSGSSNASPI